MEQNYFYSFLVLGNFVMVDTIWFAKSTPMTDVIFHYNYWIDWYLVFGVFRMVYYKSSVDKLPISSLWVKTKTKLNRLKWYSYVISVNTENLYWLVICTYVFFTQAALMTYTESVSGEWVIIETLNIRLQRINMNCLFTYTTAFCP